MIGQVKWSRTAIKYLARVTYGLGQPPRLSPNGVPIIRATNINRGRITSENLIFAKQSDLPLDRAPLLQYGEVLVVRSGAYTGDSAMVTKDWVGSAPGYDLRITPQLINPRFLAYSLRSLGVEEQISLAKSRAAQPHLNAEELGEVVIDVPHVDDQRRIADFLDAELSRLDMIEKARRRQRDLMAERWTATVSRLITLGTGDRVSCRETGNAAFPAVPASWEVLPLKRRWRIIDCKHRTPTYTDNGYPVVSPGDVSPGRLDLRVAHRFVDEQDFRDLADDLRRPRRGDIVYSRNASVGIAAYVDTDAPFTMGQDVCRITSMGQSQLYLSYFLNSVATPQLEQMQIGSTFSRVNIGALLELQVPCPPRQEQDRISARLEDEHQRFTALQGLLTAQLALVAERRHALITAAVTGHIDVATARGADV